MSTTVIVPSEPDDSEIEALSDQLAEHLVEARAMQTQLLEKATSCQTQLEALSNRPTEQPVSQAVLTELSSLKSDLSEVKARIAVLQESLTAMRQLTPSPNDLEAEPIVVIPSSELNPGESTDEPKPEDRVKRRVI